MKAALKQAEEVIEATMLDRFFVECVLSEADDFSKPKNKQRAQLLADKYNLKYPNTSSEAAKVQAQAEKQTSIYDEQLRDGILTQEECDQIMKSNK